MRKAIKKQIEIEFITFDEFVEFGKNQPDANIVDGVVWSFNYKGYSITHENNECYLIPTLEGTYNFTPQDVLITGVKGEIYPCKIDIFEATYSLVEETTFLQRLQNERTALEVKLDLLDDFIISDRFQKIDDTQQALLRVQATAMNTYLQCLKEGIQRL